MRLKGRIVKYPKVHIVDDDTKFASVADLEDLATTIRGAGYITEQRVVHQMEV
jgi:hypothetical protein